MNRTFASIIFSLVTLLGTSQARGEDIFQAATAPGKHSEISPRFFGAHIGYLAARPGRRGGIATPWPEMAVGSIRFWDSAVRWAELEPVRGEWNFDRMDAMVNTATRHGAEIVYTLGSLPPWASARPTERCPYGLGCSSEPADLADWERYVRTVASRYKGKIKVYEVWNEPKFYDSPPIRETQGFFSGSLAQMMKMTAIARRVLKEVDPDALLTSPGFDGGTKWLDYFLGAGGASMVDIIAYHFYAGSSREMAQQLVAVRQSMKKYGAAALSLWNTESGFESRDAKAPATGARVLPSQEVAAGWLAQTIVLAAAADVGRFITYAWEHASMGMINDDGSRRPNYSAFATVQNWLSGSVMLGCREAQPQVVACEGQRAGKPFTVVWTAGPSVSSSLPLPANALGALQTNLLSNGTVPQLVKGNAGFITVPVGNSPSLLSWQ